MKTSPRYVWANQFVTTEMEDGLVALIIESGKYFQFKGPVSKAIWEALETPRSVDEVVELLMGRFQVTRALCQEEVTRFIGQLAAAGLVRLQIA